MTIGEFDALFPNDDSCKTYLAARRWPAGISCPRCGSAKVYALPSKAFHWECPDCRLGNAYRFSVLVGTVFQNTNVGLRQWFRALHMMLAAKKDVAALEVQRVMGFGSYKTALYMCHRIRAGLIDPEFRQLMGIVEAYETFIGGKNKNRHGDKKLVGGRTSHKIPVLGAVERKGSVVARVVGSVDTAAIERFIREAVSTKVSLRATDEYVVYKALGKEFAHEFVSHGKGKYVAGAVHTQTTDGFWSHLKRGIMGTFHKVSAKYLPLYVAKFEWRYNNWNNADIFGAAIARC